MYLMTLIYNGNEMFGAEWKNEKILKTLNYIFNESIDYKEVRLWSKLSS